MSKFVSVPIFSEGGNESESRFIRCKSVLFVAPRHKRGAGEDGSTIMLEGGFLYESPLTAKEMRRAVENVATKCASCARQDDCPTFGDFFNGCRSVGGYLDYEPMENEQCEQ